MDFKAYVKSLKAEADAEEKRKLDANAAQLRAAADAQANADRIMKTYVRPEVANAIEAMRSVGIETRSRDQDPKTSWEDELLSRVSYGVVLDTAARLPEPSPTIHIGTDGKQVFAKVQMRGGANRAFKSIAVHDAVDASKAVAEAIKHLFEWHRKQTKTN